MHPGTTRRLWERLERLAQFGSLPNGGVTRAALSDAELETRDYVTQLLKPLGFAVRVDAAGNLIARKPGTQDALPALWLGSHLDSVVNGGWFDGSLGVMGAVEVATRLAEAGIALRHPLVIVAFCDEEGTLFGPTFGSRAIAGMLSADELAQAQESPVRERLTLAGLDPERIGEARLDGRGIRAYVELHVEQGETLEQDGYVLGIVQAIVGTTRHRVVCHGKANHAGTTRMAARDDALVRAAELVLAVRQIALDIGEGLVSTVGAVKVMPGVVNVIPGTVEMWVDVRSARTDLLDEADRRLEIAAQRIGKVEFVHSFRKPPVRCHPVVLEAIERASTRVGVPFTRMSSGAGHDAGPISTICPAGMIFVPSHEGLSHCPEEFTGPEACEAGLSALLETLLELDRHRWEEA